MRTEVAEGVKSRQLSQLSRSWWSRDVTKPITAAHTDIFCLGDLNLYSDFFMLDNIAKQIHWSHLAGETQSFTLVGGILDLDDLSLRKHGSKDFFNFVRKIKAVSQQACYTSLYYTIVAITWKIMSRKCKLDNFCIEKCQKRFKKNFFNHTFQRPIMGIFKVLHILIGQNKRIWVWIGFVA